MAARAEGAVLVELDSAQSRADLAAAQAASAEKRKSGEAQPGAHRDTRDQRVAVRAARSHHEGERSPRRAARSHVDDTVVRAPFSVAWACVVSASEAS